VPVMEKERKNRRKSGTYDKATKSTPTKGAGASCKEKGTGRRKKVEKDRGKRGNMYGQAMRRWKRSSVDELRKRAKEHCRRGILEETRLLELG